MSYEYPATAAEQKAAALLRKKGWSVAAPPCPDCHGAGWTFEWSTQELTDGSWMTSASNPCPRGCPQASFYFNSGSFTNTGVRNNTIITNGTAGMRRGE